MPSRRRFRRWAFWGVALCNLIAALLFSLLAAAKAKVGMIGLGLGRELSGLSVASTSTERLIINGQRMWKSSATTPLAVAEVLDVFEQACEHRSVGFDQVWQQIPQERQTELQLRIPEQIPGQLITRLEQNGEGALACLVAGDAEPGSFAQRFERLLESGDLGALGELRYVYVKPAQEGSYVLSMWTDGSFQLGGLFGGEGQDAPGSDSERAPRPPDSVRLLSAGVEQRPHAVRLYQSQQSPEKLLAYYEAQQRRRGWTEVAEVGMQRDDARGFIRNGESLLVMAYRDRSEPNHGTKVGLLETFSESVPLPFHPGEDR